MEPLQLAIGVAAIVLGYVAVGFAWLTFALRSNGSNRDEERRDS